MKVLRRTGLPTSYSAAEVAASLGCSEWWIKEQARRRRIPFLRSGGGYRFTSDHVQEIFHLLEERPRQANPAQGRSARDSSTPRRGNSQPISPVTSLRARSPRRARNAA